MPKNHKLLRFINAPVFSKSSEFASLSNISVDVILRCCYAERHYFVFDIPKKSGGIRKIYEPDDNLKAIQRWILRHILDRLNSSPYATAFRKGTNLVCNTSPHANNRYFFCLDLKDFFPSIIGQKVKRIFSTIGYSDRAAKLLTKLCTYKNFLPQGAATSPSLSNLVASKLDRRINGYVAKRNIIYTRYADDITLSSNKHYSLFKIRDRIKSIIENEGFLINQEKVHFSGPRRRCVITGLVKNSSEPRFSIGRRKKRTMRTIMHRFLSTGQCDKKFRSSASIEGYLSFLKGVDKRSYSQLSPYWSKLKVKYLPKKSVAI